MVHSRHTCIDSWLTLTISGILNEFFIGRIDITINSEGEDVFLVNE